MKLATGLVATVFLASCASARRSPDPEPEPVSIRQRPEERVTEPLSVRRTGQPRLAINAALRKAVDLGFDVKLIELDAGVLRIERVLVDEALTADFEEHRRKLWGDLSPEQQTLAMRNRVPLYLPGVVRRHLSISIVTSAEDVRISSAVEACMEHAENIRCGARVGLYESERYALAAIAESINQEAEPPQQQPHLPPTRL